MGGGGKSQSFLRKHSCSLLEGLPLCQGLRPREDQFHLASLWGHLLEEKVSFGVRMARRQLDLSLSFIHSLLETSPCFILRYSVDFHQASELSAFSFFSQLRRRASFAKLSAFVKWSRGKSGGRLLWNCLLVVFGSFVFFWCHLAKRKKRLSQQ